MPSVPQIPFVWQVLGVGVLTALATGLGALPFAFLHNLSPRWQGWASSFAGGMMISAAVFSLAAQGLHRGNAWQVVIGLLAGAAFFDWTARRVEHDNHFQLENLSAADSRRAILIIATMFVHSIPEGVAIGVGYATGDLGFGLLLAIAIAVHNIPEGIAVSLPLRAKGMSVWKCAAYSILTSLPQPIFAVPAFLLVAIFHPLLPFALGCAGGAMIHLAVAELIPDGLENCSRSETAWGVMLGLVVMLLLTSGLGL
jgi:ZIP family zinc transporter